MCSVKVDIKNVASFFYEDKEHFYILADLLCSCGDDGWIRGWKWKEMSVPMQGNMLLKCICLCFIKVRNSFRDYVKLCKLTRLNMNIYYTTLSLDIQCFG